MKILLIYILISALAFASCANQQPPSGGPKDETLPELTFVEPKDGALNFHGRSIVVEFSKYMVNLKVNENIFISPSVKLAFDWSGKELEVEFVDDLDSNTTYALTFGVGYSDYYDKNPPAQAYTLIFSTGQTIDSGSIKGVLYDDEPQGVYIFAFRIDDIDPDTLNFAHTKPKYRTQLGANGQFEIKALKDGTYRLFAIRDKFKNETYDDDADDFGAPARDALVGGSSTPYVPLRIGPPIDRTGPELFEAEALSDRTIRAAFSETLDTSSVSAGSFSLTDSAANENIPLASAYISPVSGKKADIITSVPMKIGCKLLLKAISDAGGIGDVSKNIIAAGSSEKYFIPREAADTARPLLLAPPVRDSSMNVERKRPFSFVFDMGIDRRALEKGLVFSQNIISAGCAIDWKSDNIFVVVPSKKLENDAWHRMEIPAEAIVGINGLKNDTSYVFNFKTKDTRGYGSVSGRLIDSSGFAIEYAVELISVDSDIRFASAVADSGKWEFADVPPGKYRLEAFLDANGDGRFSCGQPFPFVFGEKFIILKNEIILRPRWPIEDIIIRVPKTD